MRDASNEVLEVYTEYCQALLAAETEEEILAVKEQMTENLVEQGHTREEVQAFLSELDKIVEKVETEEYIFDGTTFVPNDKAETKETLQETPSQTAEPASMVNTKAGIAFGVAGAALVTTLALKKKVLKNKKNKTL